MDTSLAPPEDFIEGVGPKIEGGEYKVGPFSAVLLIAKRGSGKK